MHQQTDSAAATSPKTTDPRSNAPHQGRRWSRGRLALLMVLAAGIVAFFGLGGTEWLSFETLSRHHETITAWVEAHGTLSALAFVLLYFVAVTFSVPGAVWMSIAGGFLFGPVAGSALIVLAATAGATAVFLAARFILGDAWRRRVSGAVARLESAFRDNAFSTLLVLRLIPLFPFWLVNLVPAFVGVRTTPYVAATALGIIPGAAVYSSVGNGLGAILESGQRPDLGLIYDPEIIGPLIGLAVLAALPGLYRSVRRKKTG